MVSTDIQGKAVILHLEDNLYYGLDEMGTEILEFLESCKEINEIVEFVMKSYDVDKETCENDMLELMDQLLEKGLIEEA